jgi:diaminopimelate decarboxylase
MFKILFGPKIPIIFGFKCNFTGLGAECASIGEVLLALSSGFPSSKIVYDSPVKTVKGSKILILII